MLKHKDRMNGEQLIYRELPVLLYDAETSWKGPNGSATLLVDRSVC